MSAPAVPPAPPLPGPLPEAERPPAPGFAEAAGLLLARQVAATLRDRRIVLAAAFAALPAVVLGLFFRGPEVIPFVRMEVQLFLPILVPLVAVSLGSGLLHDDAEEGRLTFYLTAPVSRAALAAGKWMGALALGWGLLGLSLVAAIVASGAPWDALRGLVRAAAIAVFLGYPAYLAVCALLGTVFRRGFVACLVYAFGFEQVLRFVPGAAKRLSLGYYLSSLVRPHAPDSRPFQGMFRGFGPEPEAACTAVLVGVAAAGLAAFVLLVRGKEFQARNVQA
jgi:hypothetical protein